MIKSEDYENDGITIVTAFFDIGRESFSTYPRTKEEYFSYFEFWARIRNPLIVFCSKEDADRVQAIRNGFGLEADRTVTVAIDDIYSIESEIYLKMKEIEKSEAFSDFRYYNIACSNMAQYNYVMLLKYWFLAKAEEYSIRENDNYVWLDFGFNHGGRYYLRPEEFDFEWKWNLGGDIEFFCLSDPDEMSVIDSLQFQKDCIQGTVVGCRKGCTKSLWKWVKEAMTALLMVECMDDDQHLLLMVYKEHKECHTTLCGWYQAMEVTAGRSFTCCRKPSGQVHRDSKHMEGFIKRSRSRAEKYY